MLGWFALFLLALAVNWVGNRSTSLWDRDEPRFAQATREMRERVDPVLPTFEGRMRPDKPPQAYWAMWIATMIAGDNAFGVRMAQGFAGAVTVLILALFARRVGRRDFGLPDPEARKLGALAGLLLLVSPMMIVESKVATADAFLLRFLTLAHIGLFESIRPREPGHRERPWWLLFWISAGLAVLAKGFIGWILPLGTAGLLAVWMRFLPPAGVEPGDVDPHWGRLRFGKGALLSLLCVLPWAVAVFIRTDGAFLREAIGTHQLDRSLHAFEGHGGSLIYYPLSLLLGFFPGVAFLALWFGRRGNEQQEGGARSLAMRFFICWAFFPILFFTIVATKLPHYALPSYPALSILAALGFFTARSSGGRWVGVALLAFLTLVFLGVSVVATRFGAEEIPAVRWDAIMAQLRTVLTVLRVVLVAGVILLVMALIHRGFRMAVGGILLTASLALVISAVVLPALEPVRVFPAMGRELRERGIERVVTHWTPEPSLVYYGRVGVEKLGSAADAARRAEELRIGDTPAGTAALFRDEDWRLLPMGTRPRGRRLHFQGLNVARGEWGDYIIVLLGAE